MEYEIMKLKKKNGWNIPHSPVYIYHNVNFRWLPWEVMKLFSDSLLHVGGIFCDLTKTFDCMNHEILSAKLHFCGIWEVYADWFRFHIANRRQKV